MNINLHIHSKYSLDGKLNINDLLKQLEINKINIVSITDHDTCEAYKHININNMNNIKIITGIEADAIINNHTYDFLCYNFDLDEVYNYAKDKYETVDKRQTKIFNALVKKSKEKDIKLNNIESYNPLTEYAHAAILRMLNPIFLKKFNILNTSDLYRASTTDETFPLYIDMHIVWPDIKELTNIIHKNNGKVFLAHPYRYNKNVKEVLSETKDFIDGIEISNKPNNKEEVEFLYDYAKENDLLVSCGTDFHDNSKDKLDSMFLTNDMIQDILKWIK